MTVVRLTNCHTNFPIMQQNAKKDEILPATQQGKLL